MNIRTWQVAAVVLTGLLALIVVFGLTMAQRSFNNEERMEALYRRHRQFDLQLHRIRSEVHLSSIFIRDYLLDTAADQDAVYRAQLASYRRSNRAAVEELLQLIPGSGDVRDRAGTLLASLDQYWKAFAPVFEWTSEQKTRQSVAFLRKQVVPRREEVLNIAREIEDLNSAKLATENQETARQAAAHFGDLQALLWQTLGLGVIVSALSVSRFRTLELRADEQRALAESARAQMRALSMQIVETQEQERKKLSRELHDDIGQMLTGVRLELGRLEREGGRVPGLARTIAESRQLLDEAVRSVRDLAMGLRPSMLDDLGLQPALEWLVRDFSRRSGLNFSSRFTGDLGRLMDPHRTCVFRVVQEALSNCARHSHATAVVVSVDGDNDGVTVTVRDNGVGISAERRRSGLGLRGLEERARELSGTLRIDTGDDGRGTRLTMRLPLPFKEDGTNANSAGR